MLIEAKPAMAQSSGWKRRSLYSNCKTKLIQALIKAEPANAQSSGWERRGLYINCKTKLIHMLIEAEPAMAQSRLVFENLSEHF